MVQRQHAFIEDSGIIGVVEKLRHSSFSYRDKAKIINKCYLEHSEQKLHATQIYRYELSVAESIPHPDKLKAYVQSKEFAEMVCKITDTSRQQEKHRQIS